jgi:hypothetical protein
MQKQESNLVYVVSLGKEEWVPGLTLRQVVKEKRRYFHPYGSGGWPKEPPNYIGFRYDGVLQSIHHIERSEVINNFSSHFAEYPAANEHEPYRLYSLGPAIRPLPKVRSGKIWNRKV